MCCGQDSWYFGSNLNQVAPQYESTRWFDAKFMFLNEYEQIMIFKSVFLLWPAAYNRAVYLYPCCVCLQILARQGGDSTNLLNMFHVYEFFLAVYKNVPNPAELLRTSI
jgi:hypothetical protein